MKQQFPGLIVGFLLGVLFGVALIINADELLWTYWWWPEVRGAVQLYVSLPPECPV